MIALAAAFVLAGQALPFTGVNLSGGEFYKPKVGKTPVYLKDFVYPSAAEFDTFASKGMNVFRIGFLWETLQPEPLKPLVAPEVARLADCVHLATARKLIVLIDPHNYARYYDRLVGTPEVSDEVFADFWRRLATVFKGDDRVWFGLVNEPYGVSADRWVTSANAAIRAIRQSGAKNLILVPGVAWTGAWTWNAKYYGVPNGQAMDRIVDPGKHYAIEVHQYLDADSSGTKPSVVSRTIGSERLKDFVDWCRARKLKAFLGEFAAGDTPDGQAAIEDMLNAMERDRDVWLGFTWWSAGPWWGDYMFGLEPREGKDRPQMAWLSSHLQPNR
ncbi:MAG: glycoside hydrolase family 5 protein [Fimbriimonas sp.]|nr:glycoside hydrolase family 5 protein [Fimbriimonas sp.]